MIPGSQRPAPYAESGLKLLNEKQQMEQRLVSEALELNGNNISQTARQLGITRQLLQYKIKKYGLLNRDRI